MLPHHPSPAGITWLPSFLLPLLLLPLLLLPLPVLGSPPRADDDPNTFTPGPDQDGKYWIHGTGISAAFVPYGAAVSNLLVHDRHGVRRDLVGGFDNASYYSVDRQHPHFGGVPGRYANRIRNSSFAIDGETFHVAPNENPTAAQPAGVDTLHGGPHGWDWRNFSVPAHAHTRDSVTFSLLDPDGAQGFPGEVLAQVTYSLADMAWDVRMVAEATTRRTPIMLSSHTYWNLDGFANTDTQSALGHELYLPYSGRRVGVDSILVPTGDILANRVRSVNDFWSAPRQVDSAFADPAIEGNCGAGCTGYDQCYIVDRAPPGTYHWRAAGGWVARMRSAWSGLQLDVYTDQEALQVYSCNLMNGSMALKNTQGLRDAPAFPRTIPQHGCVVLEVEDWIDAINQPQWQRASRQIFGPGDDPYVLQARYVFSVNTTAGQ